LSPSEPQTQDDEEELEVVDLDVSDYDAERIQGGGPPPKNGIIGDDCETPMW